MCLKFYQKFDALKPPFQKKKNRKVHYIFIRSIEVPSKSNVSITVVSQWAWNDKRSKCSLYI